VKTLDQIEREIAYEIQCWSGGKVTVIYPSGHNTVRFSLKVTIKGFPTETFMEFDRDLVEDGQDAMIKYMKWSFGQGLTEAAYRI
jgi:hypothetical protein